MGGISWFGVRRFCPKQFFTSFHWFNICLGYDHTRTCWLRICGFRQCISMAKWRIYALVLIYSSRGEFAYFPPERNSPPRCRFSPLLSNCVSRRRSVLLTSLFLPSRLRDFGLVCVSFSLMSLSFASHIAFPQ